MAKNFLCLKNMYSDYKFLQGLLSVISKISAYYPTNIFHLIGSKCCKNYSKCVGSL